MQYLNAYVSLLREIIDDITNAFESDTTRGFLIATIALIPIFGTLFFFAVLVNAAEYNAPVPTVDVSAVQTGSSTIAIELSNNQTLLNATEVELLFDPSYIYVENLNIAPELCEDRFIITRTVDNDLGRIFYQCGTITPFAGTSTTLATISFQSLTNGTSSVVFGTSTNVLAHDGYGSNMTRSRIATALSI